jgi:hypothetical protein
LPAKKTSKISENNIPVEENKAIKFLGFEKDKAKFSIGSGVYNFRVKN